MAAKKPEDSEQVTPAPGSLLEQVLIKFLEQGAQNQLTPDMLRDIVSTVGVQSAQVMHKAVRPENETHLHISAFSYPEGDIARPKPRLKRTTYLNYHDEKEEQLTPAEIDAYNSIDEDCEARGGNFKAVIKMRGRKREELHITVPVAGINDRMNLPGSLLLLVHELKTGRSMEDVHTLLAELTTLKAELETYRAAQPRTESVFKQPREVTVPIVRPSGDLTATALAAALDNA